MSIKVVFCRASTSSINTTLSLNNIFSYKQSNPKHARFQPSILHNPRLLQPFLNQTPPIQPLYFPLPLHFVQKLPLQLFRYVIMYFTGDVG